VEVSRFSRQGGVKTSFPEKFPDFTGLCKLDGGIWEDFQGIKRTGIQSGRGMAVEIFLFMTLYPNVERLYPGYNQLLFHILFGNFL